LFVPGLGQLIAGEIAWGLFYLSGIGFCAAFLWAVLASLDRVVPTLRLLDVPIEIMVVAVAAFAGFANHAAPGGHRARAAPDRRPPLS
jgi:hypothetical protein